MENDIFVFHAFLHVLFNAVQPTRQNQRDGSLGYHVGFEIDRDCSGSFFDIDDFHLIVPVQRHARKVKRNRARVGDIRKQRVAMWNFFLIVFIL